MTKKKQRARLARILRRQGIKGARAFQVARAILQAGAPNLLPQATQDKLDLWVNPGGWCDVRLKHLPAQAWCMATGVNLNLAFLQL